MNKVTDDNDESLSFEIETGDRIVFIRCEGKVWPGPFLELLEQGIERCGGAGKRGLLVDIRDCHGLAPSTAARHELGVSISELQSARSPLVVIGVLGEEPFIDPGRFGEMVAVQNNAVFRAFTDEESAISWLESQVAMRVSTDSPPLN
ncbi:MAG: hypothetical protein QNI99_03700 [Woeseiaceae bacterium]|nr:hypothetical protein [Woeseiaceae bacterium]